VGQLLERGEVDGRTGRRRSTDWAHVHVVVRVDALAGERAMTSFAFMFDDVPEPVWKTSIGNWSSSSPLRCGRLPAAMRSALPVVEQPEVGRSLVGRGGLDAAEPAGYVPGDRLA
jgi:hypothetical protein